MEVCVVRKVVPAHELARARRSKGLARDVHTQKALRLRRLPAAPQREGHVRAGLISEVHVMRVGRKRCRGRVLQGRCVVDIRQVRHVAVVQVPKDDDVDGRRNRCRIGRIGAAVGVVLAHEVPPEDVRRIERVRFDASDVRRIVQRYAELHRRAGLGLHAPSAMVGRPEEAQERPFDARSEILGPVRPGRHDLVRGDARVRALAAGNEADGDKLLAAVEDEAILGWHPPLGRIVVLGQAPVGLTGDEGHAHFPTDSRHAVARPRAVRERERRLGAAARGNEREGHGEVGDSRRHLRREALAHTLDLAAALRQADRLARDPGLVASAHGKRVERDGGSFDRDCRRAAFVRFVNGSCGLRGDRLRGLARDASGHPFHAVLLGGDLLPGRCLHGGRGSEVSFNGRRRALRLFLRWSS